MREWAKILFGLGLLYYGVLRGAKSLIVKVKSYSFAGVDIANGTVQLYLNLLIKNPLVVGVQIKGAIGDVYVQGHKVGYVNMSYDYYLAGGHTHILPVVVNLSMGDVAQGALLNIQSGDMLLRYALQPHCLPDATDGSIPHAAALFALLAVGIIVRESIHGAYRNLVGSRFQYIGHVGKKG